MKTALYRHYDTGGKLLYVGISLKPFQRLEQHENASHWKHSIAKVECEWHTDRSAAECAEKYAIEFEKPQHNIVHANDDDKGAEVKLRREASYDAKRTPLKIDLDREIMSYVTWDYSWNNWNGILHRMLDCTARGVTVARFGGRIPDDDEISSAILKKVAEGKLVFNGDTVYAVDSGLYKYNGPTDNGASFLRF